MLFDTYMGNALIPKRYQSEIKLIPAKIDEQTFIELNDIKNNIVEFVRAHKNLLIYSSNVGNGKTTFATKILKQFITKVSNFHWPNNCPGLYINVNNYLNEKKMAITDRSLQPKILDLESKIIKSALVVFDDIGVKNVSEYDMGTLYYLIDYRTSNLMSCIFTSNLTPEQMKNSLGERLYSRIVNYSIIKEIKDGDNRAC